MTLDPHRSNAEAGELRDDLEALIESWYETADTFREQGNIADYHSYRECADQLAKTLEESE